MADDNKPAATYYAYISSPSELRRHLDYCHQAPRIGVKVRGNVSPAEYQRIQDALHSENLSRNRQDFIANPRNPPYDCLPSIIIHNVDEMNQTIERLGNNFCYLVPDNGMPWDVLLAVGAIAEQHNILQDTWTGYE